MLTVVRHAGQTRRPPPPGATAQQSRRAPDHPALRRRIWSVPFEACYAAGMEAFTPWLTPALLVALVAWLRSELISRTDKLEKRFDGIEKRFDGVATRFDEVNKRFDGVTRELADLRERMAKLEGALEGFLAGRRDRDAA